MAARGPCAHHLQPSFSNLKFLLSAFIEGKISQVAINMWKKVRQGLRAFICKGYESTMHINTCFSELGPLADFCYQQGETRNCDQPTETEATYTACFFAGRHCLHSKIKWRWKISWAIRATGTSWATSVRGTCLDAGWRRANCQMGMNPGTHFCRSCAWEVFGEPYWRLPKAGQGPLPPFANIDGSCSGAWGHSQTV